MPKFDPDKLQTWTSGEWKSGVPRRISGFSFDTRILQQENLFIAIKTNKNDGHDFIVKAKEAGASGALVARHNPRISLPQLLVKEPLAALHSMATYHRQEYHGPVIGVTGSCGKTSTKDLLALLLGDNGVHRNRENYNNQLGVPLTLLEIDHHNHDCAIIEVGMNAPGEIEQLSRLIKPTASIITSVAAAHLDAFNSIDDIAREKSILGHHTQNDGRIFFHRDCSRYDAFHNFPAPSVILIEDETSGHLPVKEGEGISWWVKRSHRPDGGSALTLKVPPDARHTFNLSPLSPGMVSNTCLAIATAWHLGVNDEDIQERLLCWHPTSLRGEIIHREEKIFYVDCYNASPASMADSFKAFSTLMQTSLPRLYVLGCMAELGEQAQDLHYAVGRLLELRSEDKVIIIGEHAGSLRDGIYSQGHEKKQVAIFTSGEAMRKAISEFEGAVLLKGSRIHKLESLLPAVKSKVSIRDKQAC